MFIKGCNTAIKYDFSVQLEAQHITEYLINSVFIPNFEQLKFELNICLVRT